MPIEGGVIEDKHGVQLTPEEEQEFIEDLWENGIPMSFEDAIVFWNKWGHRVDFPEPDPEVWKKFKEL